MDTGELIDKSRNDFADAVIGDRRDTVYISAPVLIVFDRLPSHYAQGCLAQRIQADINRQATNPEAVQIIDASQLASGLDERITDCCRSFIRNGIGSGNINVIAVIGGDENTETAYKKIRSAVKNACGESIGIRFGCVCIIDETNEVLRQGNKSALHALEKYAATETVVVLGRKRFSGRVYSDERVFEDYTRIILSLVLFRDSLAALGSGSYSFGAAQLADCAKHYWTEALGYLNSSVNYGDTPVNIDVEKGINDIQKILRKGYMCHLSSDIMKKLICNEDAANSDTADLEQKVKALYGDSLDVCLEYERKKAELAIKNAENDIKAVITAIVSEVKGRKADAAGFTNELREHIERLSEYQTGDLYAADELAAGNNSIREIYDKYVYPKIRDIERNYYRSGCETAELLVKSIICAHNSFVESVLCMRDEIKRIVDNYTGTEDGPNICDASFFHSQIIPEPERYAEALCNEMKMLNPANGFRNAFNDNTEIFCGWIKDMAEPYCRNNQFDILGQDYYYIGTFEYSRKLADADISIHTVEAGNEYSEMMLCCSRISLDAFANLI